MKGLRGVLQTEKEGFLPSWTHLAHWRAWFCKALFQSVLSNDGDDQSKRSDALLSTFSDAPFSRRCQLPTLQLAIARPGSVAAGMYIVGGVEERRP
jgi:hypothetical protein